MSASSKNLKSNKPASFACQSCRKRKRKCDRKKPVCERCKRLGVPCVYELPPKHLIKSAKTVPDSPISTQSTIVSHYETTMDLSSHIEKDPYFLVFTASAITCGSQLMKSDPVNCGIWFSLVLECYEWMETLQDAKRQEISQSPPKRLFATQDVAVNDVMLDTLNYPPTLFSLLKHIKDSLPSLNSLNFLKMHFYAYVYPVKPIANIQSLEETLKDIIFEYDNDLFLNLGTTNIRSKLTRLATLLVMVRMSYMSIRFLEEKLEDSQEKQRLKNCLEKHAVPKKVLLLVARCLELLNIYEQPTEDILCLLVYLRSCLLLESTDIWPSMGITNKLLLELITQLAIKMNLFSNVLESSPSMSVQERLYKRKLWLCVCYINLHEYTMRGGTPFVESEQLRKFSDEYRVFDDYQSISLRELANDDQIELDYHILLLKNHQFMEFLCSLSEASLEGEEFLSSKLSENEKLDLFFRENFPISEIPSELDNEPILHLICNTGKIPLQMSVIKKISHFLSKQHLLIKRLSNASLLMYYFEKKYSEDGSSSTLLNFEKHLVETIKITLQVFEEIKNCNMGELSKIIPPYMMYILANTLNPQSNRSITVFMGIFLRFAYCKRHFQHEGSQNATTLLDEILFKFCEMLKYMEQCISKELAKPKVLAVLEHFLNLYQNGALLTAMTEYSTLQNVNPKHKDVIRHCSPTHLQKYELTMRKVSVATMNNILDLMNDAVHNATVTHETENLNYFLGVFDTPDTVHSFEPF